MRPLITILTLTVVLCCAPGTADASHRLTIRHGRHKIERAVRWDIAGIPDATGHVDACWRRNRQTVACRVHETGITAFGIDGWTLDAVYSTTRKGPVYFG